MITLSVIKADVGGWVGHHQTHPLVVQKAKECLEEPKRKGLLVDCCVLSCGDDLELILTHNKGESNEEIHRLAWTTFEACTEVAKNLKLYGAGQDLLVDAFSGTVKGLGPGVAEMEFQERKSEPVVVFMADKCSPGAWNLPLFRIFADPFNTAGLVIDPQAHAGFDFEVLDAVENKMITLGCPEEMYDLLMFLGAISRYMVNSVRRRIDGEIAAKASVQKLALIAGKYVGKDDPVLIVRAQAGMPALGEIVEPFTLAHLTEGWMRGSHIGPLMPVSFRDATPTRFDGPPRVTAAGFQLNNGKLEGPVDLFDDASFDLARQRTNEIADYLRRHGPFEPHRLGLQEMEYTTMPQIMERLKDRFVVPKQ